MLHDDARPAVELGELVNLADERMVERRRRLRFPLEPAPRHRVVLQFVRQELDRDLALELVVVGQEAGELLGVDLLDFVIVTDPAEGFRYYSFQESGVLS